MKLVLFASSLFMASTSALQMVSNPPGARANNRIASKLRYSTVPDVPQAATTPAFDNKVRNLLQSQKTTTANQKKDRHLPNIKTVSSKDELKAAVLEVEDRLTVVRFHAPYCKSCKRVEPLMHSFARRNPDIQFIDVAYTKDRSNRNLVHSLGVPSFPYFHLYHPASLGLLEEHSMNAKHFKDIVKVIESYQDEGCDLPPHPNGDGIYASPYKTLNIEETKLRP